MCWKVTDMFAASYSAFTIKRAIRGFPMAALPVRSGRQQAGCQALVGEVKPSSQWAGLVLMTAFFK